MASFVSNNYKTETPLRVVHGPEDLLDDAQAILLEFRQPTDDERAEADAFWAGRTLAARKSARIAA